MTNSGRPRSVESERPLRVGLNLLFHGAQAGGVGRYARELAGALLDGQPDIALTVFAARDLPDEARAAPWAGRARWVTLPLAAGSRELMLGQFAALPALGLVHRLDVLHSPGNIGPVITPGIASVVSLMDLIWLHRGAEWEDDPRARRAMRRQVDHCVHHADRVLTISSAAAEDIVSHLGVPRERVAVTPLGVRPALAVASPPQDVRSGLGLGGSRVVLCVAQRRRYKNLERLVRALPSLDPDVVLVLAGGGEGAVADELRGRAAELGVGERLRLPGPLSEADLAGLYELSDAFALPSLIEGFGLPVLEAMLHGVPVACSDIPALREVAGDAALLFDPGDQASVDGALARLLGSASLREQLVVRGRDRAARFSWSETAHRTLEAYRDAIVARRTAASRPVRRLVQTPGSRRR